MVHATVKRESLDSFTVIFGEAQTNRASSPVDASGAKTKTMSSIHPSPSKSAPTDNLKTHNVDPVAEAKDALAAGKGVVDAAKKAIISTDVVKMIDVGHIARKAATKMAKAMTLLKMSGFNMPDMRTHITTIIQTSRKMTGTNNIQQYTDLKNEFSNAMIQFETLINSLEIPSNAPVVNNQVPLILWHDTVMNVEDGIAEVLTYISENPTKAKDETDKLSSMITTVYNGLPENMKEILKVDKNGITARIREIFKMLGKKKKGGRRTHRKRTHRKQRTHRNRTRSRK